MTTTNKTFICGSVRNCAPYLERIFVNIQKLASLFDDYHIIMSYDVSDDNSLTILQNMQKKFVLLPCSTCKMDIITHTNPLSPVRVERISNSRNRILSKIREMIAVDPTWNYYIMLDCDDVCAYPMNERIISQYLTTITDWDALSFNRENYYDMWALSYDPYIYSCWNFDNPRKVISDMKNILKSKLSKLKPTELFNCYSAFDGLAVYKLAKFIDCEYRWIIDLSQFPINILERNIKIVGSKPVKRNPDQDCEHRSFHLQAIIKYGAKIRISPLSIFEN
jgi:hypothetical protein